MIFPSCGRMHPFCRVSVRVGHLFAVLKSIEGWANWRRNRCLFCFVLRSSWTSSRLAFKMFGICWYWDFVICFSWFLFCDLALDNLLSIRLKRIVPFCTCEHSRLLVLVCFVMHWTCRHDLSCQMQQFTQVWSFHARRICPHMWLAMCCICRPRLVLESQWVCPHMYNV